MIIEKKFEYLGTNDRSKVVKNINNYFFLLSISEECYKFIDQTLLRVREKYSLDEYKQFLLKLLEIVYISVNRVCEMKHKLNAAN